MAIGKTGWNDAPSQAALLEKLDDPNQYVGAAAAYVLARLDATNAAPALLAKLHAVLSATNPPLKVLEPQALEITREFRGEENQAVRVLDPDNLEFSLDVSAEVTANLKRQAALHRPPRPVQVRMPNYDLPRALIQALRDLAYAPAADELFKLAGTDYEETAADALAKLAPGRLASNLLAVCQDPKTDSYLREKAMVTLGTLSATNCARALVPLLDDLTPIVYSPPLRSGGDWRICDRAALTIATLLGWEGQPRNRRMMMPVEQRQELMTRVREWAKTVP
jgi:HEAT repeat protein